MTNYRAHRLLHNMSGPSRTQVNWQILPIKRQRVVETQNQPMAIQPMDNTLVRFTLNSDVIHAAGFKIRQQGGDPALDADVLYRFFDTPSLMLNKLKDRLAVVWDSYNLHGAILIYPWRTEIESPSPPKSSDRQKKSLEYRTASDPLLVLNVLGRARSGILLPGFPLSFERYFLERSLCTDDDRIVALACRIGG